DIYDKVAKLKGLLITTNADDHVLKPYLATRRVCFRQAEMTRLLLQPESVYQIHGSINEHASLVFTVNNTLRGIAMKSLNTFSKRFFQSILSSSLAMALPS